jgi:hypothetical protein
MRTGVYTRCERELLYSNQFSLAFRLVAVKRQTYSDLPFFVKLYKCLAEIK